MFSVPNVYNHLVFVRGYDHVADLPVIFNPNGLGGPAAIHFYRSRIEVNGAYFDTLPNSGKAGILTHEYLHSYSTNEGLVEAVAEDEIALWYRTPLGAPAVYIDLVNTIRWSSSQACQCSWKSSRAQGLRRGWLTI